MKFEDIFNKIKIKYPTQIDISDCYPTGFSDGFMCMTLSGLCDDIEDLYDPAKSDEQWFSIMAWSISQVMWGEARQRFKNGETLTTIGIDDIDIQKYKDNYLHNIETGVGFEDMLAEYKQENGIE